jgi:uncharacterized protein YwlG (UPF0340 family)
MKFFTSIAKKSTFVLIVSLFSIISVSATTIVPEPVSSVVYQSIIVTKTDKSVILDWNTVSEFRNSYFEVERSTNAVDFKTVALVLDGFATEGTGKKYAFKEDASAVKNGRVAYYRLKQFDEYGNVSYSAVVKVQ